MPGARPRRDPFTRLASSVTRRSPVPAGGLGVARLARIADGSSGVGSLGIYGELHYIEGWTVADDGTATFTTTHKPLPGSWNLMLQGGRVHRDEFTISGKTLTVLDPTDLFLGVDTQGPWDLEIQYDYLRGTVGSAAFVAGAAGRAASTPVSVSVPATVAAGDLAIAFVTTQNSVTHTTPSGWAFEVSASNTIKTSVFSRVLDAGDISAGTWAFAYAAGLEFGHVAVAVFSAATSLSGTDDSTGTGTSIVSPGAPSGVTALWFFAHGSTGDITYSGGTEYTASMGGGILGDGVNFRVAWGLDANAVGQTRSASADGGNWLAIALGVNGL